MTLRPMQTKDAYLPESAEGKGRMSFRRYAEYRDSGVEWVGEVPVGWEVKPLKFTATINDDTLLENTDPDFEFDYVDIGSVDYVEGISSKETMIFENAPSRARRIVKLGDTIVSTVRTYLRAIASIREFDKPLIVSTGFAVIRPKTVHSDFLAYLLKASFFVQSVVARSVGVSYPAINASEVGNIFIPVPSKKEQTAVASFLDRETAKIDNLIDKQEQLIELLREKRQAVISHAVTKGLNPNAKMKDSGVEWLGKVPAEWTVKKLKNVCSQSALYGANIASSHYEGEGVRFLRTTDISDDGALKNGGVFVHATLVEDYMLNDGDLLISRSGTVGRSFLYKSQHHGPCAYAGYLVRFVPSSDVLPEYLFLFTKTQAFHKFLQVMATSSTIENVNGEKYANAPFCIPPLQEQIAIAAFLEKETAKIDILIEKCETAIKLLKERRTALISAAVTGKIDVRDEGQ